jgi:preprotein translocase subunit YajC
VNFTAFLAQPSGPDAAAGTAQPQGDDPNAAPSGGLFGGLGSLIWLLPLIFVFFMMRSQTKKQKEIESNIKLGDRVFTRGGAIGKVVKVGERHFELELAPGVHVAFRKESVEGLDVDPKKEAEKKDGDKKDADKKDVEKAKKDVDKKKDVEKPKPSLEPAKDKA